MCLQLLLISPPPCVNPPCPGCFSLGTQVPIHLLTRAGPCTQPLFESLPRPRRRHTAANADPASDFRHLTGRETTITAKAKSRPRSGGPWGARSGGRLRVRGSGEGSPARPRGHARAPAQGEERPAQGSRQVGLVPGMQRLLASWPSGPTPTGRPASPLRALAEGASEDQASLSFWDSHTCPPTWGLLSRP